MNVRHISFFLWVAALMWAIVGSAGAQVPPGGGTYADQGLANAACQAFVSYSLGDMPQLRRNGYCRLRPISPQNRYEARWEQRACSTCGWNVEDTYGEFYFTEGCSSRPDMLNTSFTGNAGSCSSGCAYAPSVGGGDTYTVVTIAGLSVTKASRLVPSGEVCTSGDGMGQPVTSDQCVQQGALTQCVRPDGQHCASASNGKQFCWQPTEAGTKKSGNEGATKAPENVNINPPGSPPANGGDWQQGPQGTASTSAGGTTNNYNISSWVSSYGKEGNGSGGEGEGEGEGEGDAPGQGVGDLYEGSERTVESVVNEFYDKITDTPVLDSVTNFMQVQGGGACPVFTVPASEYWNAMTWDAHCSGSFLASLQAIGWVLLAMAAYASIRLALT